MAIVEMKCPNCGAQVHYRSELPYMYCAHCGTQLFLYDEATLYDRAMHSYTAAMERMNQQNQAHANHMFELEQLKIERRAERKDRKNRRASQALLLLFGLFFFWVILVIVTSSISEFYAEKNAAPDTVKVPISSIDIEEKTEPYVKVLQQLKDAGFTNVHGVPVEISSPEQVGMNGIVHSVTFGGQDAFGKDTRFQKDIKVVVFYYSDQP